MNYLLNIDLIRKLVEKRKIEWTKHCLNRMNQRNISIGDIKNAINNGTIAEYYYADYPHPSCLIVGHNLKNEMIHIICGINENLIYMITAYYPDMDTWEEDMKTRRKEK